MATLLLWVWLPAPAAAQDADELAKQTQNPVILLPVATNNALGSEKFGIGPSVVALMQPGKWTLGVLFNQIWSTSGAADRSDVSSMFLQPFANYNLGGGLSVGATIEATANWEADEAWTAPLVFNVSKVRFSASGR